MSKIEELRSQLSELTGEIADLTDCEPTDESNARLDEAIDEAGEIRAQIEKAEARAKKVEEIREFAAKPAATEPGTSPEVHIKKERNIYDLAEIRQVAGSPEQARVELRARAEQAVEEAPEWVSPEARAEVANLIKHGGPSVSGSYIARHVLHTGSPEYRAKFMKAMSGDTLSAMELERANREELGYVDGAGEERAALSLTAANGGYLVPFELDPTIILTNNGSQSDIRSISRVEQVQTNVWHGVSSAGVTAEWLAEATEAADASPTFAQPTVTCYKAAAYVQASFEVLEDSNIGSQIAMLIADAKQRLEDTAHAVGNGTSQPRGIVTALQLVTASRIAGSSGAAGAADFVAADIYALDNDLPPRHRPGASFVGAKKVWNTVRQMGTANNYHAFWTDFGGGQPSQLIGYPVYRNEAMDTTIVSGSNDDIIVLGDFSKYLIADRVGLSIAYNPLVIGSSFRPTGSVGWFAHWRTGADVLDANAFRMLRV